MEKDKNILKEFEKIAKRAKDGKPVHLNDVYRMWYVHTRALHWLIDYQALMRDRRDYYLNNILSGFNEEVLGLFPELKEDSKGEMNNAKRK